MSSTKILCFLSINECKYVPSSGICGDHRTLSFIQDLFGPIARAYTKMFKKAFEKCEGEFFGLRDFYRFDYFFSLVYHTHSWFVSDCSIIKCICRFAEKSQSRPSKEELQRAILQNFGGLDGVDPLAVFSEALHTDLRASGAEFSHCSPLALIEENLHNCIESKR